MTNDEDTGEIGRPPLRLVRGDERVDDVTGLLARVLEKQTAALVDEVRSLGRDLRDEIRSLRVWIAGIVALSMILLAGVVGVGVTATAPGVSVETRP